MYGRAGLDRFKKAQSLEPFSVAPNNSASKTNTQLAPKASQQHQEVHVSQEVGQTQPVTQVGGGQSTWQPPEWAIEPRPGVYYLEVLKDGEVLDKINLDRRRNIFGRQFPTCDFVLEHNSVSRQHAAVIPHKNGRLVVSQSSSGYSCFCTWLHVICSFIQSKILACFGIVHQLVWLKFCFIYLMLFDQFKIHNLLEKRTYCLI